VRQKAAAGYLNGYADPEFIEELPRFQLPFLPQGTYRAFEISGDSMLPLTPGTIIIGEYVENWEVLKDGHCYILVTGTEGVVYKRVYNKLDEGKVLSLHSDNPAYPPYSVKIADVVEVWKAKAYISSVFPDPDMSIQKLASIVLDLQNHVIKLKS
jgi:phage repressor protein C with HTH and peptisase S24 domain